MAIVLSLAASRRPLRERFGGQGSRVAASPQAKLRQIVNGLVSAGAGALAVVRRSPTRIDRAADGLALRASTARLAALERPLPDRRRPKPFVATVMLELAAEGRLADDSVERWLRGSSQTESRSPLRRKLLSHTSGIFNYDEDAKWVAAGFAQAPMATPRQPVSRTRLILRRATAGRTRTRTTFCSGSWWRKSPGTHSAAS